MKWFENILIKLQLIQFIRIELVINETEFRNYIEGVIETNEFKLFEGFSNGQKTLVGQITEYVFFIRPKKKPFEMNISAFSKFKCLYHSNQDGFIIVTGDNLASKYSILIIILFTFLVAGLFSLLMIFSFNNWVSVFLIFLYQLFLLVIILFFQWRSASVSKYYIETVILKLRKTP